MSITVPAHIDTSVRLTAPRPGVDYPKSDYNFRQSGEEATQAKMCRGPIAFREGGVTGAR